MRFFRMTVSYDGTCYSGWQVQPGECTIQRALEEALTRITGRSIRVVASGRTDAGVHAVGQVVSFCAETRLPPETLQKAINANTPDDIFVREVATAPIGFHAIRDAVSKHYRYLIQDGPHRDLFSRAYAWFIPRPLDVDQMQAAARVMIGRHDFRSFEAAGAPRRSSVRTIYRLDVGRIELNCTQPIAVDVEADGFLYNMVRNIVGSLVLVGRGDYDAAWVSQVLSGMDRKLAGPTAPACGLTLMEVRYDVDAGAGEGGGD
jgi:tRNA pseudouridine38-40 synthase